MNRSLCLCSQLATSGPAHSSTRKRILGRFDFQGIKTEFASDLLANKIQAWISSCVNP